MLKVHNVAPFRIIRRLSANIGKTREVNFISFTGEAAPYMREKDVSKRENRSIVNGKYDLSVFRV